MSNCGKTEHCCWFKGEVCQYLVEDSQDPDYKYRCQLYLNYGSWESVATSSEYINNVKGKYAELGKPDMDCWTYPETGKTCPACGETR